MGFMTRVGHWLTGTPPVVTRSAGSVESAGGSSPLPEVLPPPRAPWGRFVTVDDALTIPTVYRAVTILATAVAQLTVTAVRGGREVTPAPPLVTRPDVHLTPAAFLKRTVIGLAGTGNAYWRHYRNPAGQVVNVEALNPLATTIEYRDGRKLYHYADPYHYQGRPQTFTADQISHLRLLEVPGHYLGLGPIQAARSSLTGALDLRDYAGNWFADSAIPTGVLSTSSQLTPEQAGQYKDRWKATQATRDVAVLGQGLTYEPIILNPADAQFLESQQFSVTDIARLFGIPAAYLLAEVNGSAMTYQNLEQADTAFLRYTLMTYLGEIEGALSALLPHGQTARFNVDGLLRPDSKARAEVNSIYHGLGVLTTNEIRAAEGLPPVPGGDTTAPAPADPAADLTEVTTA